MRPKRHRLNTDVRTWQDTRRQEAIDRIVRENPRFAPTDKPATVDDHRLLKRFRRR
ncbi:MAG TPA: hypothetical protein VFU96_02255 [Acidimicrobiia bacterium]|nr:hypothetical protein [Acidimicrobiia bacterium]